MSAIRTPWRSRPGLGADRVGTSLLGGPAHIFVSFALGEPPHPAWGLLFVRGTLAVENVLMTDLSDEGHLVVHGQLSVGTWIEAGGRGGISVSVAPAARLIGRTKPWDRALASYFPKGAATEDVKDAVRAEFFVDGGRLDTEGIAQAILNGRRVLQQLSGTVDG
jgi:hypothetical protein